MHAVPGQPATEACSLYHKQQHHQCSQQTSPQQACTACTQCARGGGRTSASMNSGDISLAYPLPRRAGQSEACTARHFNAVCTHTVLRSLTSLQNRGAAPCTPGAPAPGLEGSRCGAPRALAALLNCHSQKTPRQGSWPARTQLQRVSHLATCPGLPVHRSGTIQAQAGASIRPGGGAPAPRRRRACRTRARSRPCCAPAGPAPG
jgi:hypothetical protein